MCNGHGTVAEPNPTKNLHNTAAWHLECGRPCAMRKLAHATRRAPCGCGGHRFSRTLMGKSRTFEICNRNRSPNADSASEFQIRKPEICIGSSNADSASEFQLLTLKSAMGLSTAISASEFQLRNLQSAMGLSTAVSASEFQIRKPEICIGSSNAASASEFQIRTLKSALGLSIAGSA